MKRKNKTVDFFCFSALIYGSWKMRNRFIFLNMFFVKKYFADIFSWCFFLLTRVDGFRFLESIIPNYMKYHWLYKQLSTSLRLSVTIMAVCFKFSSRIKGAFCRNKDNHKVFLKVNFEGDFEVKLI